MAKRTVVIGDGNSLSIKNGQLVVYNAIRHDETSIPVEDIGMMIIEGYGVNLTADVVSLIGTEGGTVIFCGRKKTPVAYTIPENSHSEGSGVLFDQIAVSEPNRKRIWQDIIKQKIFNQSEVLRMCGKEWSGLREMSQNVKSGDSENTEAVAARFYFQELFGKGFVRDRDLDGINAGLNYGYSILRSMIMRSCVLSGLTMSLGVWHASRSNCCNLADDLIEPFRPMSDLITFGLASKGSFGEDVSWKKNYVKQSQSYVLIGNEELPIDLSISRVCASLKENIVNYTGMILPKCPIIMK